MAQQVTIKHLFLALVLYRARSSSSFVISMQISIANPI